MSRLTTKPTKWSLHPAKTQISLGSAWASAQSDQSLQCTQWVTEGPRFLRVDRGCSGWSESSLGAQTISLVLLWGSANVIVWCISSIELKVIDISQCDTCSYFEMCELCASKISILLEILKNVANIFCFFQNKIAYQIRKSAVFIWDRNSDQTHLLGCNLFVGCIGGHVPGC